MADKKISMNPEEFAFHLLATRGQEKGQTDEQYCKKQLLLYLTAYCIAEDFNELEQGQFKLSKRKDFERIIALIGTNKF